MVGGVDFFTFATLTVNAIWVIMIEAGAVTEMTVTDGNAKAPCLRIKTIIAVATETTPDTTPALTGTR